MPRPAASGPLIALGKRAMHTDVTTGAPDGAAVQTQTATDAGRFRRGRRTRSARKVALGLAGIFGFLVTWQLLPTLGVVDPRYFPTATETLAQLGQDVRDLEFWRNVGRTLTKWGLGLLIATRAGHGARHDHRARAVPAPRDPHDRGVPAADPVGRAHPARRAAVRLPDPVGAADHRLRELLAGVHPGAVRGRGRRRRRTRHRPKLRSVARLAHRQPRLPHRAPVPHDRSAPRRRCRADPRDHGRDVHRQPGLGREIVFAQSAGELAGACTPWSS